jgi:alpha-D-ribose 1-methylphosphonate 5-phosphate C-P lyase
MLITTYYQFRENEALKTLQNVIEEQGLKYYAYDLYDLMHLNAYDELENAIARAIEICKTAHLPVRENFRIIFRDIDGDLVQDWKLSSVAYQLIIINGNPANNRVAATQVKIINYLINERINH